MGGFVGLIRMGFQGVRDPAVQLTKLLLEFLDSCVVCFCHYVARQFIQVVQGENDKTAAARGWARRANGP